MISRRKALLIGESTNNKAGDGGKSTATANDKIQAKNKVTAPKETQDEETNKENKEEIKEEAKKIVDANNDIVCHNDILLI